MGAILTRPAANSHNGTPAGIPGHRPSLAVGQQPDPEAVPHARLRPERCRCQVPLLVLPRQAEEGQEGQRRDCQLELDPREAPAQGQELRPLAPALTTCTRSTVKCPAATPSSPCTRTWPPVTVPVSGLSPSSKSSRSRRPTTSAAHT